MRQERLTLDEIMSICDFGIEQLKSLRRRDQIALAFGGNTAWAVATWYMPADCVGLMLTAALAKAYDMTIAAQIVRAFGDAWLTAVAKADADTEIDAETDASFAVADLVRKDDSQRALMAWCAGSAALAQLPEAKSYTIERVTVVNVSSIVRAVRANAASCDLDLSSPFMPAPDSEQFAEIMAPYAAIETGVVVEVRALEKREALVRRLGEQARAIAMGRRGSGVRTRERGLQTAEAAA
jgi:hypothetical protein